MNVDLMKCFVRHGQRCTYLLLESLLFGNHTQSPDNTGMREKPIPGTPYFAGTVLGSDGHIGRHIAVRFQCAHCEHGVGRT
jgi:hypothetical protein